MGACCPRRRTFPGGRARLTDQNPDGPQAGRRNAPPRSKTVADITSDALISGREGESAPSPDQNSAGGGAVQSSGSALDQQAPLIKSSLRTTLPLADTRKAGGKVTGPLRPRGSRRIAHPKAAVRSQTTLRQSLGGECPEDALRSQRTDENHGPGERRPGHPRLARDRGSRGGTQPKGHPAINRGTPRRVPRTTQAALH